MLSYFVSLLEGPQKGTPTYFSEPPYSMRRPGTRCASSQPPTGDRCNLAAGQKIIFVVPVLEDVVEIMQGLMGCKSAA